jgi:uncharacterized protein YbcC (UPF0753/DUF2309 family)
MSRAVRPSPAPPVAAREGVEPSALDHVTRAIAEVSALVPPVWPLGDYVAVNPFMGFASARFLDARRMLRDVRDCELLLPAEHFRGLYRRGTLQTSDLETAFRHCVETYPDLYDPGDLLRLVRIVSEPPRERDAGEPGVSDHADRRYRTVSELVDLRLGSHWSSHVITDISRHCALHFDRGQATWPSPWRHLPLYEAWRESAMISRRMEFLGLRGFRRFVAALPSQPERAVADMLGRLGIPERHWRPLLLAEIFSVGGWASYLRCRLWEATLADGATIDEHVIGLVAIRLAYDAALADRHPGLVDAAGGIHPVTDHASDRPAPHEEILGRHLFQVAAEIAHRRRVCRLLLDGRSPGRAALVADRSADPRRSRTSPAGGRTTLQAIFCIDVRSEIFRRHLEAAGEDVRTSGFAGFFGLPLEVMPAGAARGSAHCPVLISPRLLVTEDVGGNERAREAALRGRARWQACRAVWKAFQSSATSCFTFVESIGLAYLPRLVTDAFGWTRPPGSMPRGSGRPLAPVSCRAGDGLPLAMRVDLAASMLVNLGLVADFARIVMICGHRSEMVNNPYRAGYDCGACGGHSGEPNARVAADLLNDSDVRRELATRGIVIPADTWFVAAVHVTTTDEVRIPDASTVPASHAEALAAVRRWLEAAGTAARLERAERLGVSVRVRSEDGLSAIACASARTEAAIRRRSRDWSEVRPEWGLAGNAAFIVAPRKRTRGLDLGGRAFLHDYDHARDPDGKVLELIMTAPMIVTSWINLQYYASAVDNRAFGSGNKVIHNVTGQFGVLLGNGGDLMTGLPWQSVSDGRKLQHEPLRLSVIIEAPRQAIQVVIERHAAVRDLAANGWLTILAWEGSGFHRWTAEGDWRPEGHSVAP